MRGAHAMRPYKYSLTTEEARGLLGVEIACLKTGEDIATALLGGGFVFALIAQGARQVFQALTRRRVGDAKLLSDLADVGAMLNHEFKELDLGGCQLGEAAQV